eukprot:g3785.t1
MKVKDPISIGICFTTLLFGCLYMILSYESGENNPPAYRDSFLAMGLLFIPALSFSLILLKDDCFAGRKDVRFLNNHSRQILLLSSIAFLGRLIWCGRKVSHGTKIDTGDNVFAQLLNRLTILVSFTSWLVYLFRWALTTLPRSTRSDRRRRIRNYFIVANTVVWLIVTVLFVVGEAETSKTVVDATTITQALLFVVLGIGALTFGAPMVAIMRKAGELSVRLNIAFKRFKALIILMTIVSLVRAVLWAYEPIVGEYTSSFFYPWFFYGIPEIVTTIPMLLLLPKRRDQRKDKNDNEISVVGERSSKGREPNTKSRDEDPLSLEGQKLGSKSGLSVIEEDTEAVVVAEADIQDDGKEKSVEGSTELEISTSSMAAAAAAAAAALEGDYYPPIESMSKDDNENIHVLQDDSGDGEDTVGLGLTLDDLQTNKEKKSKDKENLSVASENENEENKTVSVVAVENNEPESKLLTDMGDVELSAAHRPIDKGPNSWVASTLREVDEKLRELGIESNNNYSSSDENPENEDILYVAGKASKKNSRKTEKNDLAFNLLDTFVDVESETAEAKDKRVVDAIQRRLSQQFSNHEWQGLLLQPLVDVLWEQDTGLAGNTRDYVSGNRGSGFVEAKWFCKEISGGVLRLPLKGSGQHGEAALLTRYFDGNSGFVDYRKFVRWCEPFTRLQRGVPSVVEEIGDSKYVNSLFSAAVAGCTAEDAARRCGDRNGQVRNSEKVIGRLLSVAGVGVARRGRSDDATRKWVIDYVKSNSGGIGMDRNSAMSIVSKAYTELVYRETEKELSKLKHVISMKERRKRNNVIHSSDDSNEDLKLKNAEEEDKTIIFISGSGRKWQERARSRLSALGVPFYDATQEAGMDNTDGGGDYALREAAARRRAAVVLYVIDDSSRGCSAMIEAATEIVQGIRDVAICVEPLKNGCCDSFGAQLRAAEIRTLNRARAMLSGIASMYGITVWISERLATLEAVRLFEEYRSLSETERNDRHRRRLRFVIDRSNISLKQEENQNLIDNRKKKKKRRVSFDVDEDLEKDLDDVEELLHWTQRLNEKDIEETIGLKRPNRKRGLKKNPEEDDPDFDVSTIVDSRRLAEIALRLRTANRRLREELSSFDLNFFEDVEDLKYRYAQSLRMYRRLESKMSGPPEQRKRSKKKSSGSASDTEETKGLPHARCRWGPVQWERAVNQFRSVDLEGNGLISKRVFTDVALDILKLKLHEINEIIELLPRRRPRQRSGNLNQRGTGEWGGTLQMDALITPSEFVNYEAFVSLANILSPPMDETLGSYVGWKRGHDGDEISLVSERERKKKRKNQSVQKQQRSKSKKKSKLKSKFKSKKTKYREENERSSNRAKRNSKSLTSRLKKSKKSNQEEMERSDSSSSSSDADEMRASTKALKLRGKNFFGRKRKQRSSHNPWD